MEKDSKNSALKKRIKKCVIGKNHRFIAIAPLGFENTLISELNCIGVIRSKETIAISDGKVEFSAKITEAWKAVAYSRIANRILMEISTFKAENFFQLEKGAKNIPWELFLDIEKTSLQFHTNCKHSRLYHSDAVEERIRKIIEEQRLELSNTESLIQNKVIQHLYINLQDNHCTIWLDLAGEELYKRGHQRFVAEAPLKETIAAAMIFKASELALKCSTKKQSEYVAEDLNNLTPEKISNFSIDEPQKSKQDLIAKHVENHSLVIADLMAGSGTFSLETAYIKRGLIPGKCRDFVLKHQPAFKEATWNFILKDNSPNYQKFQNINLFLITSDILEKPLEIIKHNIKKSPLSKRVNSTFENNDFSITPKLKDFFSYTPNDFQSALNKQKTNGTQDTTGAPIIFLLNPPYGKRLAFNAPKLYAEIGKKLNDFKDSIVAILVPKNCTQNLLKKCTSLNPACNKNALIIETSHGGFSLNAIFAKI